MTDKARPTPKRAAQTTTPCPECGSHNVRLLWAAVDTSDFDSLACMDCDNRWAE